MRRLTLKEERFVNAYLEYDGNATRAAIQAGYSLRSAQQIGSELLLKPVVSQAVEAERERLRKTSQFTREKALSILVAMASTTPDEVIEILKDPLNRESYVGLGFKKHAIHLKRRSDGSYSAETIPTHERLAAIRDLWEKLDLSKQSDVEDRLSFFERLPEICAKLGRTPPK